MKTLKFKTNIKCEGCVAKVTPFLDSVKEAAGKWRVDISDPNKTLTVESDTANAGQIKEAVTKAGFEIKEG